MCLRNLGFIFLVVFPGALHAQGTTLLCGAFSRSGGVFFPDQPLYDHDTTLTYACYPGLKPAVEGWLAKSTCRNGEWSHQPECINVKACLPPKILNAKYNQSSDGWYKEGSTITVTCVVGYEHKNQETSTTCVKGTWSSLPVCESSNDRATDHRPTRMGPETVRCREDRSWSEVPSCRAAFCSVNTVEDTKYKNVGVVFMKYGETKRLECRTSPIRWYTNYSDIKCIDGRLESTRCSHDRGTDHRPIGIDRCGQIPAVLNGDVVQTEGFYIKYQCASFYERVGPETVRCREDGSWSEVPSCRAAFCTVNTIEDTKYKNVGVVFLKNGETERLECTHLPKWWFPNYSDIKCIDGRLESTRCCTTAQFNLRTC